MGKWCQINDLCKGLLTFGCTVSRCFRYIQVDSSVDSVTWDFQTSLEMVGKLCCLTPWPRTPEKAQLCCTQGKLFQSSQIHYMVCSSSHHIASFLFHHLLFVLLWHCGGLAVTLQLSGCHEPQKKSPRISHLLCTFIQHPIFFHSTQNLRNLKFTHVAALTHSLPSSSPTHFSPWLENSRGNLKRYYLKKAHHPKPNCKLHIWGFCSSICSLQLLWFEIPLNSCSPKKQSWICSDMQNLTVQPGKRHQIATKKTQAVNLRLLHQNLLTCHPLLYTLLVTNISPPRHIWRWCSFSFVGGIS